MIRAFINYCKYGDLLDIAISERIRYIHNDGGDDLNQRISNMINDKYENKTLIINFTSKPFPIVELTRPILDVGSMPSFSEHFEQLSNLFEIGLLMYNFLSINENDYYVLLVGNVQTTSYALLLASLLVNFDNTQLCKKIIEESNALTSPSVVDNNNAASGSSLFELEKNGQLSPSATSTNSSSNTNNVSENVIDISSIVGVEGIINSETMLANIKAMVYEKLERKIAAKFLTKLRSLDPSINRYSKFFDVMFELQDLNAINLNTFQLKGISLNSSRFCLRYAGNNNPATTSSSTVNISGNNSRIGRQRPMSGTFKAVLGDYKGSINGCEDDVSFSDNRRYSLMTPSQPTSSNNVSNNNNMPPEDVSSSWVWVPNENSSGSSSTTSTPSLSKGLTRTSSFCCAPNSKLDGLGGTSSSTSNMNGNSGLLDGFQYRKLYFVVRRQTEIVYSTFANSSDKPTIETRQVLLPQTVSTDPNDEQGNTNGGLQHTKTKLERWFHYSLGENCKPLIGDFVVLCYTMTDDGNIINLFRFTFNTLFLKKQTSLNGNYTLVVEKSELDWAHNCSLFPKHFKIELQFNEMKDLEITNDMREMTLNYWGELITSMQKCSSHQLLKDFIQKEVFDKEHKRIEEEALNSKSIMPNIVPENQPNIEKKEEEVTQPSGVVPPPPTNVNIPPPPMSTVPVAPSVSSIKGTKKKKKDEDEDDDNAIISKTKQLHWKPIKKVEGSNSVWNSQLNIDSNAIDFEKLEQLFAKQSNVPTAKSLNNLNGISPNTLDDAESSTMSNGSGFGNNGTLTGEKDSRLISPRTQTTSLASEGVIDAKAARNIEIIINSQFKSIPSEIIAQQIENLETENISLQQIENLEQFISQSGDLEKSKLIEMKNKSELLPKTDTFLLDILSIENVSDKLKTMKFIQTFDNVYKETLTMIEKKKKACKTLMQSTLLSRVLHYVLLLGNYMNRGKKRLEGEGFDLHILPKLKDTRATFDREISLMNYLATILNKDDEKDIYNFDTELIDCGVCSFGVTITLNSINQYMLELDQMNRHVQSQKKLIEKFNFTEKYKERLSNFVALCNIQYPKIRKSFESLQNIYNECCEYFHFVPSPSTDNHEQQEDELFAIIRNFVEQYKKAKKENEEKQTLKRKDRLRKCQSMRIINLNLNQ
ncbi:hypothetical protein ABK040_015495 [Willaertia magna]